jgi:hypothetical protein
MEFRNARIIERVQRRLRRKNETHNDDVCGVGSTMSAVLVFAIYAMR